MKTRLFAAFCCAFLLASCSRGIDKVKVRDSISGLRTCIVKCDEDPEPPSGQTYADCFRENYNIEHCGHVAPANMQQCLTEAGQAARKACEHLQQDAIARRKNCHQVCFDRVLSTLNVEN